MVNGYWLMVKEVQSSRFQVPGGFEGRGKKEEGRRIV